MAADDFIPDNISIYAIKLRYYKVTKLLTIGGGIILGRIILPLVGFETEVLMNAPSGKTTNLIGGLLYEYPKEILDWGDHIHYYFMVYGILSHLGYILTRMRP